MLEKIKEMSIKNSNKKKGFGLGVFSWPDAHSGMIDSFSNKKTLMKTFIRPCHRSRHQLHNGHLIDLKLAEKFEFHKVHAKGQKLL